MPFSELRTWHAIKRLALTLTIFAELIAPFSQAAAEPSLRVETLAAGLDFPWSIAFTPSGDILIIEKRGGLRIYRDGELLPGPLPGGPPAVMAAGDSGLHDIALDPDFVRTREVFIAYAEGVQDANRLAIWRAKLDGDRLVNGRTIFRVSPDKKGASHPGGRILFLPDKTFLVSVGDGYDYPDAAQDLGSHLGKILRLDRNGAAPGDNPFVGRKGVRPELWTIGHRNPQGLAIDSETGEIWEHEHGPRGGDEINLLKSGANYGWPTTTNGIDYDGELISERAHAPGIASPLIVWAPSIAPSGLTIYRGNKFPKWSGHFLLGGLASRSLIRAQRDNDGKSIAEVERALSDLETRIRDVRTGPDGFIYILTDEADGRLLRLQPE